MFLTDLLLPPLLLHWRRSVQYRGRAKPEVFKSPFSADCKRNLTFATLRLFLVCVSSPALLVELQYGLSIDPRSLCPQSLSINAMYHFMWTLRSFKEPVRAAFPKHMANPKRAWRGYQFRKTKQISFENRKF